MRKITIVDVGLFLGCGRATEHGVAVRMTTKALKHRMEDVKATKVRPSFVMPNATAALVMMREAFGAYRAVVADLDDAAKEAAWSEVLDFLIGLEGADGLNTEFVIINGSGARPE